jgi:uncharacterized protein YqgV (UPF0045/DUF77 family)
MTDTDTETKTQPIISQLYYRYKSISDEDIIKYLSRIKIVKKEHKEIGSVFGYYPLNKESMKKILKKPRNVSLTFDATETTNTHIDGLSEWKEVICLVKSTSRFFVKPDIGEVFDQIEWRDLRDDKIKAICFNSGCETLEGTDGEHFLMKATLLIDTVDKVSVEEKMEAFKKLHEL